MLIRKAKLSDLPGINELLTTYGLVPIISNFINKSDISIVVQDDNGTIIAFIFCGIVAKGLIGYIDYYTISPDWSNKGIADDLGIYLQNEFKRRRIKAVTATIAHNGFHHASLSGAIKLGLVPNKVNCTQVMGVF